VRCGDTDAGISRSLPSLWTGPGISAITQFVMERALTMSRGRRRGAMPCLKCCSGVAGAPLGK